MQSGAGNCKRGLHIFLLIQGSYSLPAPRGEHRIISEDVRTPPPAPHTALQPGQLQVVTGSRNKSTPEPQVRADSAPPKEWCEGAGGRLRSSPPPAPAQSSPGPPRGPRRHPGSELSRRPPPGGLRAQPRPPPRRRWAALCLTGQLRHSAPCPAVPPPAAAKRRQRCQRLRARRSPASSAAQRHRRCLPAPSALFSSVLPHFALAAPPARPAQQADSTARATRLSVPGLPERDGAAVPWEAAGEHFCFACPRRGLPRRPRGPGALCPALLCEQPQRCARRRAARRGALRALWDPVCAPYPTRGRTATGTEGELAVLHLPTAPREPCAAFRFHPTMPPPRSQQSAAPQGAQRGEALTGVRGEVAAPHPCRQPRAGWRGSER